MGRIVILVVVLGLVAIYFRAALRHRRAVNYAEVVTSDNLKAAAQLEPDNAEFRYRLGRYGLLTQDFPAAIRDFQAAIALNRYDARFWLDLASANLASGDVASEQQALARAYQADPTTPEVLWQTANYELVQGDMPLAMQRFRVLLEHDAEFLEPVLNVCWRATKDPVLIADRVLPPRPELHTRFLQFLMSSGQVKAAIQAWSRLIALKQPFPPQLAFPYLDNLLARGAFLEAGDAWGELGMVNPQIAAYSRSQNLIVNGNFELDLLNGGMDWRYAARPGATLVIDVHKAHSGKRSLSVAFQGSPEDIGIAQLVPVAPDTHYSFRGFMMAEDLETTSAPRFSITGMRSNRRYLLTEPVQNSQWWQELGGEFTTGPEPDLLLLRFARDPWQRVIKGRVWIDDLSMTVQP